VRPGEGGFSSRGADAVDETAPSLFRRVLGHFPTGVTVITSVADDEGAVGLAVGSSGGDRFDGLGWRPGVNGAPRMDGAPAVLH
jgi:flavin reductase (DIM6/NTAB) family NADH-FMN oxidoreductase RutF